MDLEGQWKILNTQSWLGDDDEWQFFSANNCRILLLTPYRKMKNSHIWDPKHNPVKSIHMVQSQLVDGKPSRCHLQIVFVSFNSELEQNYNLLYSIWLVLDFPHRKFLSSHIASWYIILAPLLLLYDLFLWSKLFLLRTLEFLKDHI